MGHEPTLVEVEPVRDTFISGVAKVDLLGSNARIVFYVDQSGPDGEPDERLIVTKLVLSIEDIPGCIKKILGAICRKITLPPWLDIFGASHIGRS